MSGPMQADNGKKRVRFSDAVASSEVAGASDLSELDAQKINKRVKTAQQLTRLPQGDQDEEDFAEQLQGASQAAIGRRGADLEAGGSADVSLPDEVAAMQRRDLNHTGTGSLLDDVADAEADYEQPDELMDWDGVPLEPFNLKAERERGYFDAEGNYLEFSNPEDNDAWLASLADEIVTFVKASNAPAPTDYAAPKLPEAAVRECKTKLIALLQPGENVLEALRRLGQSRIPTVQQQPKDAGPEASASNSADSAVAAASAAPAGRNRGAQMPAETRAAFETLTEASSQLLASGHYGAHSNPREQFQREVAAQEALDDLDIFETDAADLPGPSAAAAPESNAIEADHAALEHLRPSEAKSGTASTPADADPGGPADISRPQTSGTKQEEAPRDPDAPPLPRPGQQAASNASPASAMTPEEGGQTGQAVPGQAAAYAVGIAAQATALEQGAEDVPVEGLPVVSDQNGQWYAWQDGSYQLVA